MAISVRSSYPNIPQGSQVDIHRLKQSRRFINEDYLNSGIMPVQANHNLAPAQDRVQLNFFINHSNVDVEDSLLEEPGA